LSAVQKLTRSKPGARYSWRAYTPRPLSLSSIGNPDQSRRGEPVAIQMRRRGSQVELPDHSDALPRQQPCRDRFE
jgi:hypothetical protein